MKLNRRQIRSFLYVLALSLAFAFYALLNIRHLDDTAAFYLGMPIIIALAASVIDTQSIPTTAVKILLIFLMLSVPILREGFICLIIASPILIGATFLIASILAVIVNAEKDKKKSLSPLILIVAALSLEGTTKFTTFERQDIVTVTETVNLSAEQIRKNLSRTLSVEKLPKSLFAIIFPAPTNITGGGDKVGNQWSAHFKYNKWFFFNTHEGDVVYEVVKSSPEKIIFKKISDTSYLGHYLSWQTTEIEFISLSAKHTKVTVKISYERLLDPVWYFGPMQHLAVKETAKTIILNIQSSKSET